MKSDIELAEEVGISHGSMLHNRLHGPLKAFANPIRAQQVEELAGVDAEPVAWIHSHSRWGVEICKYRLMPADIADGWAETSLYTLPQLASRALEESALAELVDAAQAVLDRWDTPLWKDVPSTAEYIARLRAALAGVEE